MRLKTLCLTVIFACLSTSGCNRKEQVAAGPVEITVWHPWGSDGVRDLQKAIDRYHASQNRVRVRLVFMGSDLSSNQKLFTAIAAKTPPDAAFVDGTQDSQWSNWNALETLDKYIQRDHVKPDDFYPPCWRQSLYQGHVWSVTYCADPNFAFYWNKDTFRKAGLDPNRPPRTIAELDKMAAACTKDKDGNLESIGIIPWNQYGSANSVFTWGWAFGGKFYDDKTQTVTANDPKVVKALEWMVGYAKRLGITRIASTTSGWGADANSPLNTGQLAMACVHISTAKQIKKYAPNIEFGIAPLPGMPDGEIGSSWVGGWSLAIPKGSRHADAAWDFLHWICCTKEGTNAVAECTGLLPGYRKSPAIAKVKRDPRLSMFVQILEDTKHQRPVMPAQAFYMGALDRAVDRALYNKQTPKEALDQATRETQAELDLITGRTHR